MLMAVKDSVPELYNFVLSAHGKPSHPFCGKYYLKSAEGVQQGDPLGLLYILFCLTIHTVLLSFVQSLECFIWMMDPLAARLKMFFMTFGLVKN